MREKQGERGGREKGGERNRKERERLSEESRRREVGEERYVDPPIADVIDVFSHECLEVKPSCKSGQ